MVQLQGSQAIHLRRIGLFLDGASRASLFPFLPIMLFAFKQHKHEGELVRIDLPPSLWPSVIWSTAGLVACYNLGRSMGILLANTRRVQRWLYGNAKHKAFSRTVGVLIALQIFCFGSGMNTSAPLWGCRYLMGVCVGMLYQWGMKTTSKTSSVQEDMEAMSSMKSYDNGSSRGMDRHTFHFSVESGLAKIWLAGFGLSMLANGLIYHPIRRSYTASVLTGLTLTSWSIFPAMLFFGAIVYSVSMAVELCFLRLLSTSDAEHELDFSNKKNDDLSKKNPETEKREGFHATDANALNYDIEFAHSRDRLNSNVSNDTFYDCESYSGDFSMDYNDLNEVMSDIAPTYPSATNDNSKSVAKYVGNKCVFEDGSAATVPPGLCPSETPRSYLEMHRSYADKMYLDSQRWRMEKKVWKIHTVPHVHFTRIKDAYPHYMHGYTKLGYPVVYEKPGGTKLKEIFQSDFSIENMLHHYVYLMEYIANVACLKPESRQLLDKRSHAESSSRHGFCVVMDISELSISFVSGKVMSYLSQAGVLNKAHYPKSLVRCFLVNAPFWAAGAFSTIRSVLPENVEIDILSSSNQLEGLKKYIDEDKIPKEYGGSSIYALAEHPLELGIHNLVAEYMENTEDDDKTEIIGVVNECESDEAPMPETKVSNNVSFKGGKSMSFEDVDLERGDQSLNKPDRSTVTLRIQANDGYDKEEYTFILISCMHGIWSALQGSLETILSIWVLSPTTMGGLSYEPARTGVTLFTASVVLLFILRTNIARHISRIPVDSPMMGYRIGVGSEACLLALLPFIPYITNYDKMGVMISNVLLGAMLFIASMLGRGSSATLHTLAAQAYVDKLCLRCDRRTKLGQFLTRIVLFFRRGGFTTFLGVAGEISGSVIIAPIIIFSMDENHPYPFNGVLSFYTSGQVCLFLYMTSFFLRVTGDDVYQKVESENSKGHYAPTRRCNIVRNAAAVSIGDVTTLVEESLKPSEDYNSKRI